MHGFKEGDSSGWSETAAVLPVDSAFVRQGLYNLEPKRLGFGYGVNGAMTSFVKVPARCLHHLPNTLSFEKAALTEPCSVAYNAVCVNSRLQPGDTVAVIGCQACYPACRFRAVPGSVGRRRACDCHRHSCRRSTPGRGAENRRAETRWLPGAQGEDVADWVRNFGDGYGVDLVIDAAGVSASLKLALEIVRPAGQINKVGWGPQPLTFSLDPLVQKAVTLQGSYSHNWPIWEKVISLLASGKLNVDAILNRVSPLAQWRETFEQMHAGKIVKGVLVP